MNIPPKLLNAAKHYILGLLAASWNGGIGAVAGILGIAGVSTAGVENVHVLNAREMGAAFVGAFVLNAVMWLKSHPIPEKMDETNPPIPAPKVP